MKPLFARVLLHREKKTKAGSILLPDSAAKRMATLAMDVIAVGPSCDPSIQPGQKVLLGRFAGDWINEAGEPGEPDTAEFYICQDEDVLCTIET